MTRAYASAPWRTHPGRTARPHDRSNRLSSLAAGQPIVYGGDRVADVSPELARRFRPGDRLIVDPTSGELLHVPVAEHDTAGAAVEQRVDGVRRSWRAAATTRSRAFFDEFADRLADDVSFAPIAAANAGRRRTRCCPRTVDDPARAHRRDARRHDRRACVVGPARPAAPRHRRTHDSATTAGRSKPGVRRSVSSGSCSRGGRTCSPMPPAWCAPATPSCSGSDRTRSGPPRRSSSTRSTRRSPQAGLPTGTVGLVASAAHAAGWALFSDSPTVAGGRTWLGSGGGAARRGRPPGRRAGQPARHRGSVGGRRRRCRRRPVRCGRSAFARPQGVQHAERVLHRSANGPPSWSRYSSHAVTAAAPAARCRRACARHWARRSNSFRVAESSRRSPGRARRRRPRRAVRVTDRRSTSWPTNGNGRGRPRRRVHVVDERRRRGRAVQSIQPAVRGIAGQRVAADPRHVLRNGRCAVRRRRVHQVGRRAVCARRARAWVCRTGRAGACSAGAASCPATRSTPCGTEPRSPIRISHR